MTRALDGFVAVHRGGSLDMVRHRLLASWGADCAERVLPLFTAERPQDERPRVAVETARAWARGAVSVGEARAAAVAAHAAAREAPARRGARSRSRSGHAAATAHMADHSLGAADYAVRAVRRADRSGGPRLAGRGRGRAPKRAWQHARLPEAVRDLVVSAQAQRPDFAGGHTTRWGCRSAARCGAVG